MTEIDPIQQALELPGGGPVSSNALYRLTHTSTWLGMVRQLCFRMRQRITRPLSAPARSKRSR